MSVIFRRTRAGQTVRQLVDRDHHEKRDVEEHRGDTKAPAEEVIPT